jgi:hypothetical protein
MRKVMVALLAFTAGGIGSVVGSAPAAAYDYPWCVQGKEVGYPGYCGYQTYAQCVASASGRNVSCGINPYVAFGQQQQPMRGGRHSRSHDYD